MTSVPSDREFLTKKWPILSLILDRAQDDAVCKVAHDVRKGILDLRVEYDYQAGAWVYTTDNDDGFKCNVKIHSELQTASNGARPWRSMNMEARGWIKVDHGAPPHKMDPNKFLFHLLMTTMNNEGLYDKFLTPSTNRPYHIYDRSKKDVITCHCAELGDFSFSKCDPELDEVKVVLAQHNFEVTSETPTHVLFERYNDREFLTKQWPILGLVLNRAEDDVVSKVAHDVREGILDLLLEYDRQIGGYVYTTDHDRFKCNVKIPRDLQTASYEARSWRAMNMEARGWIGCDTGASPNKMDPDKFLFHLLTTTMDEEGLYDTFLRPEIDRPYHIYDRSKKDVITCHGCDSSFCFSDCDPELDEVKVVLAKNNFEVTSQNPTHVLFERRNAKRRRGFGDAWY